MKFESLDLRLIDGTKPVTIFTAAKVVTMNPHQPQAEAVAVQNGIIVGVGELGAMKYLLDTRNIKKRNQ